MHSAIAFVSVVLPLCGVAIGAFVIGFLFGQAFEQASTAHPTNTAEGGER